MKKKDVLPFEPLDLTSRKISAATCDHFNYGVVDYKGTKLQAAGYCDATGKVVAQKLRTPDKDFLWIGAPEDALMFGQHRARQGGRMLVITEGEIDAMSVSQVLGNTWPVVSISKGSKGAASEIKKHLEWVESFDRVVICFDMDEPGRKAAQEVAELLAPGKAAICVLPVKDANDMLKADKAKELVEAVWGAKPFRPDGIVQGKDLWEIVSTQSAFETTPYPWTCLNDCLKGARKGELVLITAGTGVGKSSVVAEIAYGWLKNTQEKIGYIALEEGVRETAYRFLSLEAGRRLLLDDTPPPKEELKRLFDSTLGTGRIWFYDHFGSLDADNLLSKIRYLVRSLGTRIIFLDHVSIVVSGMNSSEGERKDIDILMTKLASLVKELDCTFIVISHLKKIDGTPHEEGGRVTLNDLRGSGTLKQIPWDIIGLERDLQDEGQKDYTHVRVLKSRTTGYTGSAGWLKYDPHTGRMSESKDPGGEVFKDETKGDY